MLHMKFETNCSTAGMYLKVKEQDIPHIKGAAPMNSTIKQQAKAVNKVKNFSFWLENQIQSPLASS